MSAPLDESLRERVRSLGRLPLESVVAHGGAGRIDFRRLFEAADFRAPIHFVDYAVLPPQSSIGTHTHGDNEELYLVLEGRGRMHLDGEDFEVEPGSVILNRAGGTHGLTNTGAQPLRLFVVEVGLGATEAGA